MKSVKVKLPEPRVTLEAVGKKLWTREEDNLYFSIQDKEPDLAWTIMRWRPHESPKKGISDAWLAALEELAHDSNERLDAGEMGAVHRRRCSLFMNIVWRLRLRRRLD